MTHALTLDLALAYLRELEPDVADVAAGPIGEPLKDATNAVRAHSGKLEIAVLPGPNQLASLLAYDVERAAEVMNS